MSDKVNEKKPLKDVKYIRFCGLPVAGLIQSGSGTAAYIKAKKGWINL